MKNLFTDELKVVNVGLSSFKESLDASGAAAVQVDWKPPMDVDPAAVAVIRQNAAAIAEANARAAKIILAGMPPLVGLERAIDVIPGMRPDLFLHAGPGYLAR